MMEETILHITYSIAISCITILWYTCVMFRGVHIIFCGLLQSTKIVSDCNFNP